MTRHYKRKSEKNNNDLQKLVEGFITIYVLYLFSLWFTDKENFYRWVAYGLVVLILIITGMFLYYKIRAKKKGKKIEKLKRIIKEKNLEEYINNFISNYGLGKQEKRQKSWNHRNYSIAKYRIDDLLKFLNEKNISFSDNDIRLLLKEYIDERDYRKMKESQGTPNYYFKDINGTDFEILLCRLYEKIGYAVQHTGKRGDQGSDLVITKKGKRIIVQAKKYKNSVNNKAIQEAVAAKGIYNCSSSTVVTTSNFTSAARELAKANNVYLINGKKLRELLLYYLKENWI